MNNLSNDMSILYKTCFMYKNLWNPFFSLKQKYFSDPNIKTFLCSDGNLDEYFKNNKLFDNVEFINYPGDANNRGDLSNYTHRLLYYLEKIQHCYVLYWYDDMFLVNNVDINKIEKSLELMKQNSNIKTIKLSTHSSPFNGDIYYKNNNFFLQKNATADLYCVNLQPSIFRKDFLIDLCKFLISNKMTNGGSSDIELHGTRYFNLNSNNIALRSNINIVPIYDTGGIVSGGYINQSGLDFLKKENICIKIHDNFIYEKNEEHLNKISQYCFNLLKNKNLV